jgi:folate-binding protein YgfZ
MLWNRSLPVAINQMEVSMTLQRSALHPVAAGRGSNFQQRFGWELPVVYTDVVSEYRAATEGVALHDASYVGRLKAVGRDVLDLLNRMSTNKVVSLQPGQGAPTILTTDRGRILDLIGVVNTGDYILLITSPGNQQTVMAWLDKFTIMEDVAVEDITLASTMLTVLGPKSQAALESISGVGLDSLQPFHSVMIEIPSGTPLVEEGRRDFQQARIIRRGLGGLHGFDLVLSPSAAAPVWQQLVASGLTPVGMDACEAVRVQYAVPLHQREMGETYNPLEAGLIGSIDFGKGCYIGQEVIARLDTYKRVQRHLVKLGFSPGLRLPEGSSLLYDGQVVGTVTSVARIPTTGETIGLGYVRKSAAAVGVRLGLAEVAEGWAEVQELPQLFGPGQG